MESQRKNNSGKNKNTKRNVRRNARSKTRKMRGGELDNAIYTKYNDDKSISMTQRFLNLYKYGKIKNLKKSLDLSDRVSTRGSKQVINAIYTLISILSSIDHRVNSQIETLNISNNDLSEDDILALLGSIKNNTSLKILDIKGNEITDQCAESLSGILTINKTLEEVHISKNKITENGKKFLEAIPKTNKMCNIMIDNESIKYHNNSDYSKISSNMPNVSHLDKTSGRPSARKSRGPSGRKSRGPSGSH
jgi:hypothetical protein